MKIQSRFLKNSAYDKHPKYDTDGNWIGDDIPMFKGVIDIKGKIYDGELYRETEYGKEGLILCLQLDKDEAPF